MTDINEILDRIHITPKLIYYIDTLYKKMISQLRFSLGKLNGITSIEINRLFNLTELTPNDLSDFMELYPKDVYVMRQPIYNLLALIVIKAYIERNQRLALDTNMLLGMVFLGRLKYKYIRVVDQNMLDKTIMNLSKKSYIGLHGVLWMVAKLTKDTHDMWMPKILQNLDDIYPRYRYIIDLRNKFNQVMKTVARIYYYNMEHRNEVDRSVIIKNRTNEIINYIVEKSIPPEILEYAANLCNSSPDKINNLHYNIQVYQSMQSQMTILINNVLDRLIAYMNIYKQQFNKNVDINDPTFVKSFFTALKRSTIILKLASDPVFTAYQYDRFEVISYALITTLFVDSMNHNADYYGSVDKESGTNMDDFSSDNTYYNDSYNSDNSSYFDESIDIADNYLEYMYEGLTYDNKELFEIWRE